ncbi:MAG: DUF6149 family protein [Haloferacaceae archaeon]
MKINQNVRHFASRKALETPGVRSVTKSALVSLHTRVFLKEADEDRRDERREHLDDFFAATMDTYLAALQEGYSEAKAREITHIQANFDFATRGWLEMMEFPADEVDEHFDRYSEFFERHGISIDDPLGEFRPKGGIADAPATPEKFDREQPNAVGGYADDVYVDTGDEVVAGGREEPEEVDVSEAVGVGSEDADSR